MCFLTSFCYNSLHNRIGWNFFRSLFSARDSNVFTVSVNVEPQSKVTFNLTYEQLLTRTLGLYENIINVNPGQVSWKITLAGLIYYSLFPMYRRTRRPESIFVSRVYFWTPMYTRCPVNGELYCGRGMVYADGNKKVPLGHRWKSQMRTTREQLKCTVVKLNY